MKQKPDEFPDQWVRQTLSQLPDAPPPGSSFDSERLWAQLRPELQLAPSRWLAGWVWWAAAVCFAGLTLGWFWLHQSTSRPIDIAMHGSKRKSEVPMTSRRTSDLTQKIVQSKAVVGKKEQYSSIVRTEDRQKERLNVASMSQVVEPSGIINQTPEVPTVTEVLPASEQRLDLPKSSLAISAPKRRFKVVHENELRAEEATRPKLYPTENFVRIGTGKNYESTSDERRPVLTLPLTHKPNQ